MWMFDHDGLKPASALLRQQASGLRESAAEGRERARLLVSDADSLIQRACAAEAHADRLERAAQRLVGTADDVPGAPRVAPPPAKDD